MNINNVDIQWCKTDFVYPWDKGIIHEVTGLRITRIIAADENPTPVELMNENTPKPNHPVVQCVSVTLDKIDDFRFKETSVHIPLI